MAFDHNKAVDPDKKKKKKVSKHRTIVSVILGMRVGK